MAGTGLNNGARVTYNTVRNMTYDTNDTERGTRLPGERLEVRLDGDRRRKLAELAGTYRVPVSEAVRMMIDEAYEDVQRTRRLAAARALAGLAVEDVPDPQTLSRQLDGTYEPAGLPGR